jgi:hypothetical protein
MTDVYFQLTGRKITAVLEESRLPCNVGRMNINRGGPLTPGHQAAGAWAAVQGSARVAAPRGLINLAKPASCP